MLIVFKDSEHGISLLQSSLKENQFIYLLSSLKGFKNNQMVSSAFYNFFSPVKDSPASDIPLVDDAARVEVAENAFLVLCRHNSKDLRIFVLVSKIFKAFLEAQESTCPSSRLWLTISWLVTTESVRENTAICPSLWPHQISTLEKEIVPCSFLLYFTI